jgi:regulatory protein
MVITGIKRQVKRSDRYSIFLDDVYTFSLNAQDVVDQDVRIGQEVDSKRLVELKKISSLGLTYNKLLRYLAVRQRSRKELLEYFRRKQLSDSEAGILLKKVDQIGMLDDKRFASSWVDSRRKRKHSSSRQLRYELHQKGIDERTISEALAENDISDEEALAALIEKKRRISRYKDDKKLMVYLVGQGYPYGLVKEKINGPDIS